LAMIEFKGVSFRQPNGIMALRDINLQIEAGEMVSIVGGNGAGKTTLLKHLNGLLKPTTGSVKVFGRETREMSVAQLSRRIGLVFQNSDHQLFSDTAEAEVLFGLKNFGFGEQEAKRRADEVFRYFGLEGLRGRAPLTLSGGEKKRLCIAAVMAWDPDVLVLDEPTVGQDYTSKNRILETVRKLVSDGKTVIIVSHDLEFLWPLNPRTIVMSEGRILADGEPQSIFLQAELLSSAGLKQPQLVSIAGLFGVQKPFGNVNEALKWFVER